VATRYVDVIGGQRAVRDKARSYADAGDLRFAAELLKHAVFADPDDTASREALAGVYERLGYGAENATWRGFYLTGALELRGAAKPPPISDLGGGMAGALTIEQLFDTLAVRIDGPRAANESLIIDWRFTDTGTDIRLTLSNGVLIPTVNPRSPATPDATLILTKAQFMALLGGRGLDGTECRGDPAALTRLMSLLDTPDPGFAVVTP
jgi:alkyl sulfatase BDS1-like metallo-beta-lactamase superfamily hydrolase